MAIVDLKGSLFYDISETIADQLHPYAGYFEFLNITVQYDTDSNTAQIPRQSLTTMVKQYCKRSYGNIKVSVKSDYNSINIRILNAPVTFDFKSFREEMEELFQGKKQTTMSTLYISKDPLEFDGTDGQGTQIKCPAYLPKLSLSVFSDVTFNQELGITNSETTTDDIKVGDLVWVKNNKWLMEVRQIVPGATYTWYSLENSPNAEKISGTQGNPGTFTRDEIEPYVATNSSSQEDTSVQSVGQMSDEMVIGNEAMEEIKLFVNKNAVVLAEMKANDKQLYDSILGAIEFITNELEEKEGEPITGESVVEMVEESVEDVDLEGLEDIDFEMDDLSELDIDDLLFEDADLEDLDVSDLDFEEEQSETEERPIWLEEDGTKMYVISIPSVPENDADDFRANLQSLYGASIYPMPLNIKVHIEESGTLNSKKLRINVFEKGDENEYLPDVEQVFYETFGRYLTNDDFRKPAYTPSTTDGGNNQNQEAEKPIGGEVLDFGQMIVGKAFGDYKAENFVYDYKGYDWKIYTYRDLMGKLVSFAQNGKVEWINNKVYTFTSDSGMYRIKLMQKDIKRLTEKAVRAQQEEALMLFSDKVDEAMSSKND